MHLNFWGIHFVGNTQSMIGPTCGGQYTHQIDKVTAGQIMSSLTVFISVSTVVVLPSWFASLSHNSIFFTNAGSWCNYTRQGGVTLFCGMHVFMWCCLDGDVLELGT